MHYVINPWFDKGGMLSKCAPWCGLEAYSRVVTVTKYILKKWEKT